MDQERKQKLQIVVKQGKKSVRQLFEESKVAMLNKLDETFVQLKDCCEDVESMGIPFIDPEKLELCGMFGHLALEAALSQTCYDELSLITGDELPDILRLESLKMSLGLFTVLGRVMEELSELSREYRAGQAEGETTDTEDSKEEEPEKAPKKSKRSKRKNKQLESRRK